MPGFEQSYGPMHDGMSGEVRPSVHEVVTPHDGEDQEISSEWRSSDETQKEEARITDELKNYKREGIFGLLSQGPVKRIVGGVMLFVMGMSAVTKGAFHAKKVETPQKIGDGSGQKSNKTVIERSDSSASASNAARAERIKTVQQKIQIKGGSGFVKSSHAPHFKGSSTTTEAGGTAKIADQIKATQADLDHKIAEAKAAGYTIKSAGVHFSGHGHASHEFNNAIKGKLAGGLNENLRDTRAHDVVEQVSQSGALHGVSVEFGPDHDVRVPQPDGTVKSMPQADFLKAHNMSQSEFNNLAKLVNSGHHVPAQFDFVKTVLDANRGFSFEVTGNLDVEKTTQTADPVHPPTSTHHDMRMNHEIIDPVPLPQGPHDATAHADYYIPPQIMGNPEKDDEDPVPDDTSIIVDDTQTDDRGRTRIHVDPPPPPPPPPPPFSKKIHQTTELEYNSYAGKGNKTVSHQRTAGTAMGFATPVGNIPRVKNEFSATPKNRAPEQAYLEGLSKGARVKLENEFRKAAGNKSMKNDVYQAKLKKYVAQRMAEGTL